MEASGSMWARMRQKPFALWVIAGGLWYAGLALLSLAIQFAIAGGLAGGGILLILFVFIAIFLISGAFSFLGKRWAFAVGAAMSILLLALFGPNIATSLSNPAESSFWIGISIVPLLILVLIFAVLAYRNAKTGLEHKPYLSSVKSTGGLLTVAVIGFVIGGLVVGAIGGSVILGNISGVPADIEIVKDASSSSQPYVPGNFTVHLSAGGKVSWINKDTTAHTVTSTTGLFDSGTSGVGSTWSHTFTTAGTYPYYCTIHPMMTGTIVVMP